MSLDSVIAIKINQAQRFTTEGNRIVVTIFKTQPMKVCQIKTAEVDGYEAVQLGIGTKRVNNITKAVHGHIKKSGLEKNPPRFLREIRLKSGDKLSGGQNEYKLGGEVNISDILKVGDLVAVTGISKGKGFQGGVKRHHFKGGPRTHGQSDRERAPGAIGQTTTPGRVYRGKRMAGRMGNDTVTVKNLKVIDIDNEKNLLAISGLVPGGRNSLTIIRKIA